MERLKETREVGEGEAHRQQEVSCVRRKYSVRKWEWGGVGDGRPRGEGTGRPLVQCS